VADFRFNSDPSERRRVFIILQLAFWVRKREYPVREITSSFLGYEFQDTAMRTVPADLFRASNNMG